MRSSVQTSFLAGPSLVGYSPSVRQGEGRVEGGGGEGWRRGVVWGERGDGQGEWWDRCEDME